MDRHTQRVPLDDGLGSLPVGTTVDATWTKKTYSISPRALSCELPLECWQEEHLECWARLEALRADT